MLIIVLIIILGRVYVPALYFYVAKPGTVVSCTIAYTPEEGWRHGGEVCRDDICICVCHICWIQPLQDIPWTVVDSIELIDDKAEMATALSAYGSGLKTAGKTTNLKVCARVLQQTNDLLLFDSYRSPRCLQEQTLVCSAMERLLYTSAYMTYVGDIPIMGPILRPSRFRLLAIVLHMWSRSDPG